MLKIITLLRDRVDNWETIHSPSRRLTVSTNFVLRSRICSFAGENGTGKSTLLEAIAAHYGFGREGGNRRFSNDRPPAITRSIRWCGRSACLSTKGPAHDILCERRVSLTAPPLLNRILWSQSLHTHSQGEMFFTILNSNSGATACSCWDESEAALSPQRQLASLVLIHDVLQKHKDAQFIISSHSPILPGYPKAQILSFDDGSIHEVACEETSSAQIVRHFVNQRESFVEELLGERPSWFEDSD